MSAFSQTLLLYAPVPLFSSPEGYLLEDQACNGLKLWADNFDHLIVMFPVEHGVAPPSWIPLKSAAFDPARVEIVGLPTAYRPEQFVQHYSATRRKISELIDRAQYLSFAIGGLIGDWGAVAAWEAHKKKRRFAVWADRVESEVVRQSVRSGKTAKARLKAALIHRPMAMLERALIRRAAVGLFHGAATYEAYAQYANASEIVHDISLGAADHISDADLAAKVEDMAHGPLRICYIGRADAMKGPMDWIQAMSLLDASGVDFEATWLGDGELLTAMKETVVQKGLSHRVKLPGFLRDRTRLLHVLRRAHIFVFCHKTPESPRNLIEALVSGTPIVGYDSPFPKDLLSEHGGGLLTPLNDVVALAKALENLGTQREKLAELAVKASLDGKPFNDVAVYKHRSDALRSHLQ